MTRIIIRHGLSEANNRENWGKPAFGHPDAPLMEQGRIDAVHLGPILEMDYGIAFPDTPVATSEMRRTQETAQRAGFHLLKSYHLLNEVSHGLSFEDKKRVRETGVIPDVALMVAREVLDNPPPEEVWFTHGLLIASMCKVLGVYQEPVRHVIPRFCEIRELPI